MAASKPISLLYIKITLLISLNNNFGTLNACSGLFPFRHTTLAYYVWLSNSYHYLSESNYLPIKFSQIPRYAQNNCLRTQFCTCYDINLNNLLR
jgi:hypothetical protein